METVLLSTLALRYGKRPDYLRKILSRSEFGKFEVPKSRYCFFDTPEFKEQIEKTLKFFATADERRLGYTSQQIFDKYRYLSKGA